MDLKANAYFERSAFKYSKSDIQGLLDCHLPCAGPLLATVLNGIDNLGGMCYGFKTPVGNRSIRFMKEKMNIPHAIAEFLYKAVRCGIVHQAMPTMGLKYHVSYHRVEGYEILYNGPEGYVTLIVTELAYQYLDAIDKIAAEPDKHIKFYPQYNEQEKQDFMESFTKAKEHIQHDIESYSYALYEEEERERLKRAESSAAYTGHMQYDIDLPALDE